MPTREKMQSVYDKLRGREGLHAAGVFDLRDDLAGPIVGDEELLHLANLVPEGQTWIVRRPKPQDPDKMQSVYVRRENGMSVAIAVEFGHPIIKSMHRMLLRAMRNLHAL